MSDPSPRRGFFPPTLNRRVSTGVHDLDLQERNLGSCAYDRGLSVVAVFQEALTGPGRTFRPEFEKKGNPPGMQLDRA